jgi:hypothetical protein
MGCRAPQTRQPERGLGRPAGGRRDRRGCPDAGHAARRSVRRADVRPMVGRTSDVHAPVRSGVSGRTRVRCPRPLRPRCPHRAGSWHASVRRAAHVGHTGFDVSRWSASGMVVAARIGPGGKGLVVGWQGMARTSVEGRPGPPLRMRTGCGVALAARPTKGAGPSPGCRSLAGEHEKEQVPTGRPTGASWAGCRL